MSGAHKVPGCRRWRGAPGGCIPWRKGQLLRLRIWLGHPWKCPIWLVGLYVPLDAQEFGVHPNNKLGLSQMKPGAGAVIAAVRNKL